MSGGTRAASGWRGFINTTSASGRTCDRTAASKLRRSSSQPVTQSPIVPVAVGSADPLGNRIDLGPTEHIVIRRIGRIAGR
jgi:hypothetical protein